jgi:hypothetical protein
MVRSSYFLGVYHCLTCGHFLLISRSGEGLCEEPRVSRTPVCGNTDSPIRSQNDIQPWNWQEMLSFFGAKNYKSWRAATMKEFNDILANQEFAAADKIQVLEVMM